MAAYTSRASATVVSPSVAATAARSAASLEEDIRAARASGASSNTRPRFVLDGAERVLSRSGECGADRDGAREEVLVRRVVEAGERGHVTRFGGARLEQAGELRRGGDFGRARRRAHADVKRPSRCSTIVAATSTEVASCRPRHPGIPFTSTT